MKPNVCSGGSSDGAVSDIGFLDYLNYQRMCDHVFASADPRTWSESGASRWDDDLPDSGVVFCRTNGTVDFFHQARTKPGPYTLVSQQSDLSITQELCDMRPANVTRWFGSNADVSPGEVGGIPCGVKRIRWPAIERQATREKNPRQLLYVSHAISTNPAERALVRDCFATKSWAQVECYEQWGEGYPVDSFYRNVHGSSFVASPAGNGIDCFRTWEALHLGTIPICRRTKAMEHFEDLPILLVDQWEQVTSGFLEESLIRLQPKWANVERLRPAYWLRKIRQGRRGEDGTGDKH